MRRLITQLKRDDTGATLPLVSLLLVVLLGMAGFATDLGWFYLNTSRVQRAADAAALAGVIHMPQEPATAETTALAIASSNGYTDGVDEVDVTVSTIPSDPNQLEVTVEDTVDTFFMKVFGFDSQTIARTARAEYIPPLPLGSPKGQFGNACDPRQPPCDPAEQPNFWANIHGKYTNTVMGDAFSPYCRGSNGNPGCTQNEAFRSTGYIYGIEGSGASSFTVEFVDMEHRNISGGVKTSDGHRTGDRGCEDWGDNTPQCGQTVTVKLFAPDPTPLDLSDNTLLCEHTYDPEPQLPATAAYVWLSPPGGCWTVNNPSDGIYPLQIVVEEPSDPDYSGLNRYAVRADSPGDQARLYGLGDISIYNNASGTTTDFYLAELDERYRGKTFVVEMYDPGEAKPGGYVQLMEPDGVDAWTIRDSCVMYVKDRRTDPWGSPTTQTPCQFFATSTSYNGKWIKLETELDVAYACGTNCWWKINYDYPGTVNDTTTWRAYVIGNPVHLIPTG